MRALIFTLGFSAFASMAMAKDDPLSRAMPDMGQLNAYSALVNGCSLYSSDAEAIRKSGAPSVADLKKTSDLCDKKPVSTTPAAGSGAEAGRANKNQKNLQKFQKQCIDNFEGSAGGQCMAYRAHTASQLKSEIADLQKELSEAQNRQVDAEKEFQQSSNALQDQSNQAMLDLMSNNPAKQKQAIIDVNAAARAKNTQLSTDTVPKIQTDYSNAQLAYKNAVIKANDDCDAYAQSALNSLLTQLAAKVPGSKPIITNDGMIGGHINVSGSGQSMSQSALATYKQREKAICLSNQGARAAQVAANTYQAAVTTANQALQAVNKERAEIGSELQDNLAKIQIQSTADANKAQLLQNVNNQRTGQLNATHMQQQGLTQQNVDNLNKQITIAQQEMDCIKSFTGSVSKDEDSDRDTKLQDGVSAFNELLSACSAGGVHKGCTDYCSSVLPYLTDDQKKKLSQIEAGGFTPVADPGTVGSPDTLTGVDAAGKPIPPKTAAPLPTTGQPNRSGDN